MRARIVATVVVAASLLLSTAGCSFFAPQSTLKKYDPSDGVGVTVGQVKVRNALLLTKDGQEASFLVNLVNDGQKTVNVLIQYDGTTAEGTSGKVDTRVQLDAGEVKTFGSSDTRQLIFSGIDSKPGSLFPVFVQYGTETGDQLLVPVLDGSLSEYSKLLPMPLPTATPPVNPTVIPVPTPTAKTTP
ncbi:hypothetical protein [Lacisediminihabitans sp. H27-G8]|uniref:hypothetical protein n=1 Tax=Lacisediminihabitans sp. H27-G8 TaxID=3111909 RepID=UPI0038FCC4F7